MLGSRLTKNGAVATAAAAAAAKTLTRMTINDMPAPKAKATVKLIVKTAADDSVDDGGSNDYPPLQG